MGKKNFIFDRRFWKLGSIRSQLIISLSTCLFLFIILLGVSWRLAQESHQFNSLQTDVFRPTLTYSNQIARGVEKNRLILQDLVYDTQSRKQAKIKLAEKKCNQIWAQQILPGIDTLASLSEQYPDREVHDIFLEIKSNSGKVFTASKKAIQSLSDNRPPVYQLDQDRGATDRNNPPNLFMDQILRHRLETDILPLEEEINILVEEIIEKMEIQADESNLELAYYNQFFLGLILALIVLIILIMALSARMLYRQIIQEIGGHEIKIQELIEGNLGPQSASPYLEFYKIGFLSNKLRNQLKKLEKYALQIGEGDFNQKEEIFSDEGSLGKAFRKMQSGLKIISDENVTRYWINNGVAKFSDILTRNAGDLKLLSQEIINELVDYLEINQGGFFITQFDQEGSYMELSASYAYNKARYVEKKIKLGEGLIGQVWQEAELLYLREIPQNYVEITSGLGEATPKVLLLIPLKANQEVQGLIELASFKEIPEYKIEFVRGLAENVGQAIAVMQINDQTRKLLIDSQEMTKALQAQDEQMRQNMFELQEAQRKMNDTQKVLANKEANLDALINNTSHAILAFDTNNEITVVNYSMRQIYLEFGLRLQVGMNILEISHLDNPIQEPEDYRRVLAGEKFELLRVNEKHDPPLFYELHYNPIRDEDKAVIGASIFMENITEQKLAEMQLKNTEANLTSLINDTEDHIMALDKDYKITVINEAYKNEYQKRGFNIEIGHPIFNYMTSKEEKRWRQFYDRVMRGERFRKVIDSGDDFIEKSYQEYWFNPIRNEYEIVTGVSIFSRDITESKKSELKVRQLLLESLESTEHLKNQEEAMRKVIRDYEIKIKDLEAKINANASSTS